MKEYIMLISTGIKSDAAEKITATINEPTLIKRFELTPLSGVNRALKNVIII